MPVNTNSHWSRRRFLRFSLVGTCACLLPWTSQARASSYSVQNRDTMIAGFKGIAEGMRQMLATRHGPESAKDMSREAVEAFSESLADFPDIGPDNPNMESLTQAAWLVAMRIPMAQRDIPAAETGRLLYDMCWSEWAQRPQVQAEAEGIAFFAPENTRSMLKWAEETQKRTYPGDWVATVFIGNESGEVAKDYSECGALKLFKAYGVTDVAPYFCLNDFTSSRFSGTGLSRSKTLAQGDEVCNFRYKKGRPVAQDSDTEIPIIRARNIG